MNVGLTYDLRQDYLDQGYGEEETAEFDKPETIEAIEGSLQALGFATERIGNARHLVEALTKGRSWDLVFNVAEGLYGFGRESLVPALLDAWRIPYVFSDPLALALTLHKGQCKRVVRDLGVPTPDFAVVERPEDIAQVNLPYPLFAKPVAEGTGKGVTSASRIDSPARLDEVCRDLLARFGQPVLVETYLSGREFTVAVVGTGPKARVLGLMEVVLLKGAEAGAYTYSNKEDYLQVVRYRIPDDAEALSCQEVALASHRGLGLRDASRVDVRLAADGAPHFIEVNPLAGMHPVHSDTPIICNMMGVPYVELIAEIMRSALDRLPGCGVALPPSAHPVWSRP